MRTFKALFFVGTLTTLITYVISSGQTGGFYGIPFRCSLDDCIQSVEGNNGDFASYLRAGDLLIDGRLFSDQSNWWLVILWPPGMAVYFATLSILSFGSPIFSIAHLVISIGLWAFLLTRSVIRSKDILSLVVGSASATLLLGSAPVRNWMFGDPIFYSETISIALFSISVTLICSVALRVTSGAQKSLMIISGSSGLLLAIAAHLRGVFDLVGLVLAALFIVLIAITFIRVLFARLISLEFFDALPTTTNKSLALMLACWVVAFFAATLPWRLALQIKMNSLTFSPASSQVWATGWIPNEHGLPEWALSAGMNGFCVSYPDTCKKIAVIEYASVSPYSGFGAYTYDEFRITALGEIFGNPMPWLASRTAVGLSNLLSASGGLQVWGLMLIVCTLMSVVAISIFLYRKLSAHINRVSRAVVALVPLISGFVTVVPLLISSFEPRYFYPILIMPILVFTNLLAEAKTQEALVPAASD